MTVPSQVSRDAQLGDGVTTVFTVPFRVLQDIAMRVYIDDVQKALTTDFVVTGIGAANTTVTFLIAPANGTTITFLRQVELTQETDYVPNDPFPAESHENALDKLTMIAQQQQDALRRSVRIGPTLDPDDYNVELPAPDPSTLIGWDTTGQAMRNYTIPEIATAAAYANKIVDLFTGTGAQTDFILSADPASLGNLDVSIDGVVQVPGVDFTYAGTTLAFLVAPTNGAVICARFDEGLPAAGAATMIACNAGVVGAVDRTVSDRLAQTVCVKDFGAVGDGVTDDTAAFNLMTAFIRSELDATAARTVSACVVIPRGRYSISTWDLTALTGRQVDIHGEGAVILARTAGKNVIDCTNSRWLRFHDLTIYSPSTVIARSAIQMGPNAVGTACGNNLLENVFMTGHYTVAPFLNLGAETTQLMGCNIVQQRIDAANYAAIFDGASTYLPESDYLTITRTPGDLMSFTNDYVGGGTQLRNEGGGSGVYLGKTEGFTFDQSCYVLTFNASAFIIRNTGTVRNKGFTASCQFENSQDNNPTPGNIGIRNVFEFTGDGTPSAIEGFTCDTFGPQCEEFLIRNSTGGALRISNARIRLAALQNAGAFWFSAGAGMSVDGQVQCQEASKLNMGVLSSFVGVAMVNDVTTIASLPPVGSACLLYDRVNAKTFMYGATEIFNRATTAALVKIGNAGSNWLEVQGSNTNPALRVGGSGNADLRLVPLGTGDVRFGANTVNADAPIIGYVTIKTDDGITRKLATIA